MNMMKVFIYIKWFKYVQTVIPVYNDNPVLLLIFRLGLVVFIAKWSFGTIEHSVNVTYMISTWNEAYLR